MLLKGLHHHDRVTWILDSFDDIATRRLHNLTLGEGGRQAVGRTVSRVGWDGIGTGAPPVTGARPETRVCTTSRAYSPSGSKSGSKTVTSMPRQSALPTSPRMSS